MMVLNMFKKVFHPLLKQNLLLFKFIVLLFCLIFFNSCLLFDYFEDPDEFEVNGDFNEAMESQQYMTVRFQKDANSSFAFEKKYKIGEVYPVSELPNMYSDDVWNMNPGYDLGGWKFYAYERWDGELQTLGQHYIYVNEDSFGFIQEFYALPVTLYFYGDDWSASSRTPYTIILRTQNLSDLTTYSDYSSVTARGLTNSLTNASIYAPHIPGFGNPTCTTENISANGSTVVYAYYDRRTVTVVLFDPVTSTNQNTSGLYQDVITGLTIPTRAGYEISQWKQTDSGPDEVILSSMPTTYPIYDYTYTPVWTPARVPYTVWHRCQNVNLSSFDFTEDQTLYGYTGSDTEAAAKTYFGFELQTAITQDEILGDGTTTINVFYVRKSLDINFHGNGGEDSGSTVASQNVTFGVETTLNTNAFARTGYTFKGWATSLARANSGTVDYIDGDVYTPITETDVDLYAVWQANQVNVSISVPNDEGVGISYERSDDGSTITFTAVLPDGDAATDYTFNWFYTNDGIGSPQSTSATWDLTVASLDSGIYQISLIAIKDSVPSGGTIQIEIE